MSNMRTRQRGAAPTTETAEGGWWQEGEEGFDTAEKLQSNRKYQASRFYLKVDDTADLVLLDDGKGFFIHEYEIYDQAKKRTFFETVRKDQDHDPLEQLVGVDTRFKDASYVMYLSCIDLRPFVDKHGNQRYFTKKLLPVKRAQMKKFKRYLEQHGTYRGMMVKMTRDDPKGAKIGDPEFMMADPQNGKALLTEEDILENFGGPKVMSQDGKTVLKEENADCYAFDYRTELAPAPPEELAKRWGAPYNPGSSQANQQMTNQTTTKVTGSRPAAAPPPLTQRLRNTVAAPASQTEEVAGEEKPKTTAVKQRTSLVPKEKVTKPAVQEEAADDVPFDTDEGEDGDWYEGDEEAE